MLSRCTLKDERQYRKKNVWLWAPTRRSTDDEKNGGEERTTRRLGDITVRKLRIQQPKRLSDEAPVLIHASNNKCTRGFTRYTAQQQALRGFSEILSHLQDSCVMMVKE
jgi:hypothetical protein